MTTQSALALASFDDLAQELGRRYHSYALIVNEQVLVDGSKFLERHGYKGNYNVLLGLIDSLHDAVLARKKQESKTA
jgi:hypothetical protein